MVISAICGLVALLATVVVSTNAWYQNPYLTGLQAALNAPVLSLDPNNAPKSTINNLSSIGHSDFAAFTHPGFPSHRIRVKKTNFCDPTVKLALVYYYP